MSLAQKRISESIDEFYTEGSQMGKVAGQYRQVVTKIDEDDRAELDEIFRRCVLDPLGRYVAAFPEFREVIKKRERKLLDYDRTRANLKKQTDKPMDDVGRFSKVHCFPRHNRQAEADAIQAKDVYEEINNKLFTEIPMLIELRILYLDPCFEALVKSQWGFYRESAAKFERVKNGFETAGKQINGYGMAGQCDLVLQQMKQLSICQPLSPQAAQ